MGGAAGNHALCPPDLDGDRRDRARVSLDAADGQRLALLRPADDGAGGWTDPRLLRGLAFCGRLLSDHLVLELRVSADGSAPGSRALPHPVRAWHAVPLLDQTSGGTAITHHAIAH